MRDIKKSQLISKYDIPYLQNLSVFGALNEPFLTHLVQNCELKKVKKDSVLFTEGEFPKHFYAIVEGEINIYRGEKKHDEKMATLRNGECVGFISMLCMHPLPGDVAPERDTVVMKIQNEQFASLPIFDGEQFSIFLINLARDMGRTIIKERE